MIGEKTRITYSERDTPATTGAIVLATHLCRLVGRRRFWKCVHFYSPCCALLYRRTNNTICSINRSSLLVRVANNMRLLANAYARVLVRVLVRVRTPVIPCVPGRECTRMPVHTHALNLTLNLAHTTTLDYPGPTRGFSYAPLSLSHTIPSSFSRTISLSLSHSLSLSLAHNLTAYAITHL